MSTPRLDQLRVRHLNFLEMLASLGSLAATAEQLSMTPSAASMMLKEIEGLFGVKLFVRQGRGLVISPQGRALLPRCQTVLGEIGAMRSTLLEVSQPLIRIGAFPHTTSTVLPSIVSTLVNGTPCWKVRIVEHSANHLLQLLQRGDIDLLLGRLPNKVAESSIESLDQFVLYQSSLAVVASSHHPLLNRPGLAMKDLLAWPWVLPSSESTTRVAIVDAFLRAGLTPPAPIVESPSFFYSLSLVADTDFLTCCARSAAVAHTGPTALLPIDMGLEATPVALFWRRDSAEARRAIASLNLRAEAIQRDRGVT